MRVISIIVALLFALPTAASDRPCTPTAATYENPYYVVRVAHEDIDQSRTYTASPPATLIAQHYITDTFVITMPNTTPPITRTIWTFEYSETTEILGYAPLTPRPNDYAYTFRASTPFYAWTCGQGRQAHIFLPVISR